MKDPLKLSTSYPQVIHNGKIIKNVDFYDVLSSFLQVIHKN